MNPIDTYHLATGGQNSFDTYTLASNGILVSVLIEDITPPPAIDIPIGSGGFLIKGITKNLRKKERDKYNDRRDKKHDEKEKETSRKKVTVCATIDGREFCETLIVLDKPNLTVKDINVDVTPTENEPKIKITVTI